MFREIVVAMGLLATLAIALPVRAVPIINVVDPADIYIASGSTASPCPTEFDCAPGSLSFTHRITDDGFNIGDTITSASLVIHLAEIVATGVNHEKYQYEIGLQTFGCLSGNCVPNSGVLDSVELDSSSLADLATDGILRITISSSSGGFLFADSRLTVQTTPHVEPLDLELRDLNSVPVSPTLLLLGAGVVALGASRYRGRPMA